VTFSDIAGHYIQEELTEDQNQASVPKAYSTTATYRRYLRKWVLPRWGDQAALMIAPLDLENWLKELGRKSGLENQTRSKIRQVIGLVYKHAQRVGFLPRTEQANPIRFVRQSTASNFDPIILTPVQAFAIINQLGLMLRTLVLVTAATALRISEILALQWRDIDAENQCIYVRRAYVYGRFGKPKSKASKRPFRSIHYSRHICSTGVGKRPTARKRTSCSRPSN
jgi:integrase